jgi:serine/threonine protein kinase
MASLLNNDSYRIGHLLGRGGFGITYLAWDFKNNQKVAIKEYLPKDFARRSRNHKIQYTSSTVIQPFENGRTRFIEEATTLWTMRLPGGGRHECIVEVHDCFPEHGTAYLVMEYLGHWTFEAYLNAQPANTNRIPYEDARRILDPIMDGLRFVHQFGLFHRDVAADNICITPARTVKLIDFGSAKFAVKYDEPTRTHSITVKDGYSPVELYGSTGHGPWTDVYALGATLYKAVAGFLPPPATDRQSALNDQNPDPIVPPGLSGVSLPPGAEQAILKALAVRPRDRFQTIGEFQTALPAGRDSIGNSQSLRELQPPPAAPKGPGRPRWPLWFVLIAACLVVGIVSCLAAVVVFIRDDVLASVLFALLVPILVLWGRWLILRRRAP